jgi:hypothetical protein
VLTVVSASADRDGSESLWLIDKTVREGARPMLAEALRAQVDVSIGQFVDERDESGRRLVERNSYHAPREVVTSAVLSR